MSSVSRSLYLAGELSESERLAAVQRLTSNFSVSVKDGEMLATALCSYCDSVTANSHAPSFEVISNACRDAGVSVGDKRPSYASLSVRGASIGDCLSKLLVALQPVAVLRHRISLRELNGATERAAAAERLILGGCDE